MLSIAVAEFFWMRVGKFTTLVKLLVFSTGYYYCWLILWLMWLLLLTGAVATAVVGWHFGYCDYYCWVVLWLHWILLFPPAVVLHFTILPHVWWKDYVVSTSHCIRLSHSRYRLRRSFTYEFGFNSSESRLFIVAV